MSPQSAATRQRVLTAIVQHVTQAVNDLFALADQPIPPSLADLEARAQQLSQDCLLPAVAACVDEQRAAQAGAPARPRCACGRPGHYKGSAARTLLTRVGLLTYRRPYYYCRACRRGYTPLDLALGIGPGQFSAGVQEGICQLGAAVPFAQAATLWTALTGLPVSARAVARLTEARGQQLEAHFAVQQAQALAGTLAAASVPAALAPRGAGVWAVALDAARVCFRDDWHEVKAGVVFWARRGATARRRRGAARGARGGGSRATAQSYVARVGSMAAAGERLYAETVRRGIDAGRETVVCLGDGAPSIWEQFATHFPQRVEVLDWYHAMEHVWAAGQGLYGEGTATTAAWVAARETELWAGNVAGVVAALEAARGEPQGAAAAGQLHYFRTNAGRMRYGEYRAAGYPVGSGTVESACKRVVGARAKGAGMHWSGPGVQAVLSLRAEQLSGRWAQSWPLTQPARPVA